MRIAVIGAGAMGDIGPTSRRKRRVAGEGAKRCRRS